MEMVMLQPTVTMTVVGRMVGHGKVRTARSIAGHLAGTLLHTRGDQRRERPPRLIHHAVIAPVTTVGRQGVVVTGAGHGVQDETMDTGPRRHPTNLFLKRKGSESVDTLGAHQE